MGISRLFGGSGDKMSETKPAEPTKTMAEKPKIVDGKPIGPDGKPLKPCCVCPETKKVRDACIMEKGEENCGDLIEAHKQCMRDLGFRI